MLEDQETTRVLGISATQAPTWLADGLCVHRLPDGMPNGGKSLTPSSKASASPRMPGVPDRDFLDGWNTCKGFLSKGRQVYVEGRLTTRQYEAKDG